MYAVLLTLAGVMAPQSWAKGGLNCTVVDETDKPIAKQEFILTSAAGKQSKKKTNDQGEVKFSGLDDGSYTLNGEIQGYVTGKSAPMEVSGNAEKPCKFTLVSATYANTKLQAVMQLVQEASQFLQQAVRLTGDDAKKKSQEAAEKFKSAEQTGKALIQLMPGEAAGHYVLSVVYAYQGNEAAGDAVKKAAELNPEKFKDKVVPIQMQTLNVEAELAKQKNDFNGALKKYEAMLALAPNDSTVYYNMAVTYAATKDYVKALKNIDLVLAVKPDDQDAKQRKDAWEKALEQQLSDPLKK